MVIDTEQEKKEIVNRYRRLLRKAKPILKEGDAKLIKKAFSIAAEAHKDMRRKSGEPYIFHPLAVAQICVEEIGLGTTSIVAALLHDVVEDTDVELADIERPQGITDGVHTNASQRAVHLECAFELPLEVRLVHLNADFASISQYHS